MYAHERALDAKETANNLVSEYYEIFLRRKNSEKTKEQYEYMKFKVSKFCDWETLTFEEIDVRWLKDWHASMERIGNSPNTCADVEINLRALFNSAIEDKVIKEDCYPFKVFKIRKADTKKRSLTLSQLRQLMECEKEPHQHRYWDCFMLSLYLCGINMVDLLHLPRQESLDRIGYLRSKTGIWVEFNIPQDARVLLEKYAGKKYLVNFAEGYKDYEQFVRNMNAELKRIGKVIKKVRKTKTGNRVVTTYKPIVPELSSYWARHTYATIAFDCDMPEQIIDMSMAHKSPYPMTDIYIARNMRKINKYLPKICDVINGRITIEELEELG